MADLMAALMEIGRAEMTDFFEDAHLVDNLETLTVAWMVVRMDALTVASMEISAVAWREI